MNNLEINHSLCIGCGACIAIDDEHFAFSDEGLANVKSTENLGSPTLVEAVDACPTDAIKLNNEGSLTMNEEETKVNACECGDECECGESCECGEECTCETEADAE